MRKSKTAASRIEFYARLADKWDKIDLADVWDSLKEVHFDIDIKSTVTLCRVDRDIWKQVSAAASQRGVPTNTLINLWLKEKASKEPLPKSA